MLDHSKRRLNAGVSCRPGRINIRAVVILAVVVGLLGGAAAVGHKVRKRIIGNRALAAGQAALEKQDWAEACKELRKYLVRYPDDAETLAKYAAASMAVRPLDADHIGAALGAYRRLLTLRPGDDQVCEKLTKLYLGIRDFEEAAYICRQRLEAAPDDPDAALALGRALLGGGKADESVKVLAPLVERRPDQVEGYLLLSRIASQDRTSVGVGAAKKWLDQAVANNPQSAQALAHRALFLQTDGRDPQAAMADLEAADALKPRDPAVLLLLMDLWLRRGAFDRADAELRAVETLDETALAQGEMEPEDLALLKHTAAARVVLRRGAVQEAARQAEAALKELTGPTRVAFLPTAVDLYLAGQKLDAARECLKEYREARIRPGERDSAAPEDQIAVLEAAVIVRDPAGNAYDAIEKLRAVALAAPDNARAWRLLTDAHLRVGQRSRAAEALEEYVRRSPGDADAAVLLARLCLESDPARAARYAAQAELVRPQDLEAKLARIEAQVDSAGSTFAGSELARRVAAELADLQQKQPQSSRVHICLAKVASVSGDPDGAMAILERSAGQCDDPLATLVQLAGYAQAQKRLDKAVEAARKAISLRADVAVPRVLLAQIQAARGEVEPARATLDKAVAELSGQEQQRAQTALARFLLLNNARGEGLALLRQLIEKYPLDTAFKMALLRLPEIQADREQAQKLVDQLRGVEGETGVLWPVEQARLWLGDRQWRDRQREIEGLLSRVTEADPSSADAVLLLAQLYSKQGDLSKAEQACRRALDSGRVHPAVAASLLSILERQGRFAEAAGLLNRLPRERSDWLSQHRIDIGLATGDFASATDELQSRIVANPQDAVSRVLMARLVYVREKDVAAAMKLLDEAQAAAPDLLEVLAARVAILQSEGKQDEALRLINEMVSRRNDFNAYLLRAEFYAFTKQLDLAEKDYQHLTSFKEDSARAHVLLGSFYRRIRQYDQALASFDAGLQVAPGNIELRRALVAALVSDERPQLRQRGQEMLDALLKELPDDPDLLLLQANTLMERGGPEARPAAESALERVVQRNPQRVAAYLGLIEIARQAGDLARASQLVMQALGSNPGNVDLLCARALLEVDANNLSLGQDLAQKVIASDPNNLTAYQTLVSVALRNRDVEAAEHYNSKILEISPNSIAAKLNQADILVARGQPDEALKVLDAYYQTATGRKDIRCLMAMAQLYQDRRDFTKAAQLIDEADRLRPSNLFAFRARCQVLAGQGRFDEIAKLASGVPADAGDAAARLEAAALTLASSRQAEHLKEATAVCQRVVEIAPQRISGHINLGQIAYLTGDVKAAEQAYRKALELDPYNQRVLNDLAWIVGVDLGNVDEAIGLANTGVVKYPDDAHLRDTRAALLLKSGRLEEAGQDLEKCLALKDAPPSTRVSALRHLSEALAKQGHAAEAKQRLREALTVDQQHHVLSDADKAAVEKQIQSPGQ